MAHAEVTLTWADGEHTFKLALGQLRELQEKTNAGPLELLKRLHNGTWRIDDPREVVRLGLIGGGAKPVEALKLVTRYVDERPATEGVMVAQAILMVALYPEEEPDKSGERAVEKSKSPTGSPSPSSTASVQ